jgi:hypothetical protein
MTLRRLFVPLILGCCVMALAAPVTAAGQSPGTDSVIGTASDDCIESVELDGQIFCVRGLSITVDVESGAVGENPTGTVVLNSLGPSPGGSVFTTSEATCLSVSGRVAIIGLAGRGLQNPVLFFVAGLLRVVDAGGPDSGADTFEFAYQTAPVSGPPLPGPTSCSTFPGTFPRDPLLFPDFTNNTGDVVVTDAQPPLPTTIAQCKHGGWQQFGFKNLGKCVAFVVQTRVCEALERHGIHLKVCPPTPPRPN